MIAYKRTIGIVCTTVILCGCTPEVSEEVVKYVDTIRNRKSVYKGDLPEFPKGSNLKYTASNLRDPFIPYFLTTNLESPISGPAGGPNLNRKREELESYPLDSLSMVGTMERNGVFEGLIRDSSGKVHRVEVGDYMGQNAGEIKEISAGEIRINQWLSDNKGGWREFPKSIYLVKTRVESATDKKQGDQ